MSRPFLLLSLLVIMVLTSRFEWNQQLVNEVEARPAISQKQQYVTEREESVKEKIILFQESNIKKLNKLVRSLQEQLLQCKGGTRNAANDTNSSLTALLNELEQKQLLD